MNESLRSLLRELESFAAANDAAEEARERKMLNITPETGELVGILVRATKARRVLEIGTSNGYSTLWLAEAAQSIAGSVVTVDVSPTKAELARHNLERSGLAPFVRQEVTDAGRFLSEQPAEHFDLLFLDSDRKQYVAWWPLIQHVLAPGGLLVVDNAVSHPDEMEDFIREVQNTPGWRSVVVPVGKGELLAHKVEG